MKDSPHSQEYDVIHESGSVTIPKEEYEELKADQRFLRALQHAGVDSWDGYEEAQDILDDWDM